MSTFVAVACMALIGSWALEIALLFPCILDVHSHPYCPRCNEGESTFRMWLFGSARCRIHGPI